MSGLHEKRPLNPARARIDLSQSVANECHMSHRSNNFDFLRLMAAASVLVDHQFRTLGMDEPSVFAGKTCGLLGVYVFFTISGYLVTQSWLNDPHVVRFAIRRLLRIWPALAVVTCLSAFILGPAVTSLNSPDYFSSPDLSRFFISLSLVKANFELPGVFNDLPAFSSVNASIRTIPVEVRWYVILAVAGVARIVRFRWIVLAGTVALAGYLPGFAHATTTYASHDVIEYGLYFCYGVCLFLFRDVWQNRRVLAGTVLVALAFAALLNGLQLLALWLVLPFAVIVLATASTPVIRRFGRFGDLSYGIYIYGFPIQQTIAWTTHWQISFFLGLLLSVALTTGIAWLSWHLIEAPALALKHYSGQIGRFRPVGQGSPRQP